MKVLLCDDEIHILRAAEIKVTHGGHDVRIARDGNQAWELIQAERPDVLVTDVQMPHCDGFELTRRVRDDPSTRELPVIMLTAKGYELAYQELSASYGVSALLAKPFSPRELLKLIEQLGPKAEVVAEPAP